MSDPEAGAGDPEADERRRLRLLRMVVDLTTNVLVQGRMTRPEAEALRARRLALLPASTVPTASKIVDFPAPVGPTSAAAPRRRICSRRIRYQFEMAMSVRTYTVSVGRAGDEGCAAQLAGLGRVCKPTRANP